MELTHTHAHIYRDTHTDADTKTKNTKKKGRKRKEHETTISKPQYLTSVRIKTAPWEFQTKLLHYFFVSNHKSNLHSGWAASPWIKGLGFKIRTHRASSKMISLFLTKYWKQHQSNGKQNRNAHVIACFLVQYKLKAIGRLVRALRVKADSVWKTPSPAAFPP